MKIRKEHRTVKALCRTNKLLLGAESGRMAHILQDRHSVTSLKMKKVTLSKRKLSASWARTGTFGDPLKMAFVMDLPKLTLAIMHLQMLSHTAGTPTYNWRTKCAYTISFALPDGGICEGFDGSVSACRGISLQTPRASYRMWDNGINSAIGWDEVVGSESSKLWSNVETWTAGSERMLSRILWLLHHRRWHIWDEMEGLGVK